MRPCDATIPAALLLVLLSACSPTELSDPAAAPAGTAVDGEPGAEQAGRADRVLRLVLRLTADGVETVSAVEFPGRVNRRDPHRSSAVFFRAVDRDGRILFERGFRLETHLRSEAQGPGGMIEGRRVPLAEPVFTVALPRHPNLDAIRFFRASERGSRDEAELLGEVRP
jgi:hypothetical protein